jgi:hippurate hydrolase
MQTLVSRRINPVRSAVVTVGRIEAGTVHNVIAEHARLEGTVRSADTETRKQILAGLERMIDGMRTMCGATLDLNFFAGLPAVINDARAAGLARKAAVQVVGEDRVLFQGGPSLGGEDFAFYQQRIPGCLVRFGAARTDRQTGPAHSGQFDFDEQALATGAAWLVRVAREALEPARDNNT